MITGADFKLMIIHSILIPVMVTMLCMTPLHIAMADKVVYQGNITSKQNREFFKRMQGKTVGHLVISSTGGEVEAGIELGLWVFRQKLTLQVRDSCFSSCANYVFPAAVKKSFCPVPGSLC